MSCLICHNKNNLVDLYDKNDAIQQTAPMYDELICNNCLTIDNAMEFLNHHICTGYAYIPSVFENLIMQINYPFQKSKIYRGLTFKTEDDRNKFISKIHENNCIITDIIPRCWTINESIAANFAGDGYGIILESELNDNDDRLLFYILHDTQYYKNINDKRYVLYIPKESITCHQSQLIIKSNVSLKITYVLCGLSSK